MPNLHVFGQMSRITNLSLTETLQDRSQVASYISTDRTKYMKVQLQNDRIEKSGHWQLLPNCEYPGPQ